MSACPPFDNCAPGAINLGPLTDLNGTFVQPQDVPESKLPLFFGWNLISLPEENDGSGSFRLLENQYTETLSFDDVDPLDACNRGQKGDQHITGLQYSQHIVQVQSHDERVHSRDFKRENPDQSDDTNKRLPNNSTIHQEAGQWLFMPNPHLNDHVDIARMSSIPHGDAVLAFGHSHNVDDFKEEDIPIIDARPQVTILQKLHVPPVVSRAAEQLKGDYLGPFNFFDEHGEFANKFLFKPVESSSLLRLWVSEFKKAGGKILSTVALPVSTQTKPGAVRNIPFVIKEANASIVESTFWVHEVEIEGVKSVVLQYLQIVTLDFLNISWPHVSINTLVRKAKEDKPKEKKEEKEEEKPQGY